MRKRKIAGMAGGIAVVLVILGAVVSCESLQQNNSMVNLVIKPADYESDSGGLLTINNLSPTDVAVFAGKIERGNFMGAIKAQGSRSFDLTKLNLTDKGAFLFRVASVTTVDRKGKTGISEDDVIYTGLVAYEKGRQINHDIFAKIDDRSESYVYVSNLTKYVVELRLNGSTGDKVAVLGPGERSKKLWIRQQELPYTFFPTYIYVDPNSGEMDVFTDTVNLYGVDFIPMPASQIQQVYEFKDPGQVIGGKQYNVAFIRLTNNATDLVQLQTISAAFVRNDRGFFGTNRGDADVYQLASDQGPDGREYPSLGIRRRGVDVPIAGSKIVKPGYEYALTIPDTGDISLREIGKKSDNVNTNVFLQLD
ncbi:MAG: hypothetical protein LBI67_06140 [Treponema sp.]|jgi:hypothetical protein|nr:hypothetical protein [Treponema sp.]